MEISQQQQQQQQSSSHHLMKRVIDSKTPQECLTSVSSSPKPNQVSTVLLYGIPIVSLFIEGQERLCLAQISNTLLKQYSYNEIHNRRVALGITCVQCTPVQLEILRRAGAMPVSSRRCGMITRREAERLCKSFLGDNTPPRLPEDFAFSVHHECAWGCRGSFLPARYNSSRAKCIKCAYCGLFFSPNKFIFHSHRIGPADKYVQPDAANFNSWRRHMKLSGNPPEEIVHAWEDVKAMFNGGTRKRLIISATSSSGGGGGCAGHGRNSSRNGDMSSPKRLKEIAPSSSSSSLNSHHEPGSPVIHAAAAVTVVSAATAANRTVTDGQHPIRPIQLLPNGQVTSSSSSSTANNANSLTAPIASSAPIPTRIPSALCSDLPLHFTRGFMMDYMWHAQNKASAFQFSNYALPWIKRSPGTLFLNQQAPSQQQQQPQQLQSQPIVNGSPLASHPISTSVDDTYLSGDSPAPSMSATSTPPPAPTSKPTSLPFYNNSAFRPVINHHHHHQHPVQLASHHRSNSACIMPTNSTKQLDDDQRTSSSRNSRDGSGSGGSATIKDSLSSDDDDEMVDIETTEEDDYNHHQAGHHQRYHEAYQSRGVTNTHPYRHIDDLIAVKIPKSASPVNVETIADNINCWNDPTTADYLKKRLACRNLTTTTLQTATTKIAPTPSPPLIVRHSSPASSSSCGAEGGGGGGGGGSDTSVNASDLLTAREHHHHQQQHHNMLRLTTSVSAATATPPTIMLDPMNAIPRAAAAAAAAAAVAIAAFSHSGSQSPSSSPTPSSATTATAATTTIPSGALQKSFYDGAGGGAISPSKFSPNIYTCDKGLTNSIYSNLILNNNNNSNNNNNNMNSNSRSSSNISNSSLNNAINNNNNSSSNNNHSTTTTAGGLGGGNTVVKIKNHLNGRLTIDSPINCSGVGGGGASVLTNDRLCSVARLSFDRMDYASVSSSVSSSSLSLSPFYHRQHETNKHFPPFRHQSEPTTTTLTPTSGGIG